MRRLYVLLPNADRCQAVVADLEAQGVPQAHLHALAGLGQELKDLPAANIWQRTELAHALERGIGLGGVAGLLGGLLAIAFPPAGIVLGGGALLAGAAAGAGFGAMVTALIGSQEHNHALDRFREALARGEILLLVDVPRAQEAEIREILSRHHPDAGIGSVARPPVQTRASGP